MSEEYSDQLSKTELSLWAYRFNNIAMYSSVLVKEHGILDEAEETSPYYMDDVLTEGWETVSDGYTSQYAYDGPVMHDSEHFGGALAERVINEPGVYALIPAEFANEDDEDEITYEGWLVVKGVGK